MVLEGVRNQVAGNSLALGVAPWTEVVTTGTLGAAVGMALRLRSSGRARPSAKPRARSIFPVALLLAALHLAAGLVATVVVPAPVVDPWLGPWRVAALLGGFDCLLLFAVGRYGATGLLKGARTLALPALVGGVVALVALRVGAEARSLWNPLGAPTFALAESLLRLTGAEVVADMPHMRLGTRAFAATLTPTCSGYEGLGLGLVVLTAYLAARRSHLVFPRALLVLPVGLGALFLANGVRIATLLTLGAHGHPSVARGGFHSNAGWILFNLVTLTLMAVVEGTASLHVRPTSSRGTSARLLAPLAALLGVTLVTGALSAGFDLAYPARVLGVAMAVAFVGWGLPSCSALRRGDLRDLVPLGLGLLAFAVWATLASSPATAMPPTLAAWPLAARVVWIAMRLVGGVVVVPYAEELAFRGYLFEEIARRNGGRWALAAVVSTAAFALLHRHVVAGLVAGALFALARQARGRLADAVVAHAVTNGALAVLVLVTGDWSWWT